VLDVSKARIAEMEMTLAIIKESTVGEHTKEIQQVKHAYEEEIKKKLKAQEEGLQVKFYESMSLFQKTHANDMKQLKTSQNL